jgi:oxygen-independent coproporphyrinogen III oxidase
MTGKSLYVHAPFCTHKCGYCHFYVIPPRPAHTALYQTIILKEWEQKRELINTPLTSVYFGGGTPSLLPSSFYREFLEKIPMKDDCEVTLEANPETLTLKLLSEFKESGINRLSIGVQAFQNRHLQLLERTHSSQKAVDCFHLAKQAGFKNITLDLMYDLPNQTIEDWKESLEIALTLPIQHIALYNLTIEPHTGFHKKKQTFQFPSEELSNEMLNYAVKRLAQQKWERYELAAFCLPGFESRHNSGYWTGRPFLGLGPSAFSYWEGARFRNQTHFNRWVKGVNGELPLEDFREKLSSLENQKELFALKLRLIKESAETLLDVAPLISNGWIEPFQKGYRLTEKGKLFHDTVAEEIMAL